MASTSNTASTTVATVEWPQLESNGALPCALDIPGGDLLFGGSADILFGEEELIDIYCGGTTEAAADVNQPAPSDAADEVKSTSDPPLGLPAVQEQNETITETIPPANAEGGLIAGVPTDDGLGALRPKTSFNDFGQLMPSASQEVKPDTNPTVEEQPVTSTNVSTLCEAAPQAVNVVEKVASNQDQANTPPESATNVVSKPEPSDTAQGIKRAAPLVTVESQVVPEVVSSAGVVLKKTVSIAGSEKRTGGATYGPSSITANLLNGCSPSVVAAISNAGGSGKKPNVAAVTSGAVAPGNKRRKVTAPVATQKKPSAAARRSAAADAVAQFAPLAQNQVAKIRESASLLSNSNSNNGVNGAISRMKASAPDPLSAEAPSPMVGVTVGSNSTNPLRTVSVGSTDTSSEQQALKVKRPTSPNDHTQATNTDASPVTPTVMSSSPAIVSPCEQSANAATNGTGMAMSTDATQSIAKVASAPVMPLPTVTTETSGSITSTAHVTALTSSPNWVSQNSNNASAAAVAASKRARRQNLTPDERAKQNRDRNREHARNTRLRKKAYVEELKKTLTEIVAERDAAELERQWEKKREKECREIRYRVMEEFLKLRSAGGNVDENRWEAILDSNFVLKLPQTNFRKMVGRDDNRLRRRVSGDIPAAVPDDDLSQFEQALQGRAEVMEDAVLLSEFLDCLGKNPSEMNLGSADKIQLNYTHDRNRFFMDGCTAMMDWSARTAGISNRGPLSELSFKGLMRATFVDATNQLLLVELTFDTGVIESQISRISSLLLPKELTLTSDADASALLDSLDVPHFEQLVLKKTETVSTATVQSVTSSETSENSAPEGDVQPMVEGATEG